MAIKISNTTVINDDRVFLPNNSAEGSTTVSIAAGSVAIDINSATVFQISMTSSITAMTLNNVQSSGRASSFVLILVADGTARTVVWPASFKWPSGTAPTLTSTAGKKDVFTFFTIDGGTSWQALITGQNI